MTETPSRTRDAHASARRTRAKTARGDVYALEADAIKALAHPKRLLIVDLLSDGGEHTVTELMDETGLSQSNVSQNLAIMRAAALVTARRDGNNVYYALVDKRILKAVELLRTVMEIQLEDKQFVVERARFKAKERFKQGTALSLVVAIGLFSLLTIGAFTHPLFVGGGLEEMTVHANLMVASPTFDVMMERCLDVATTTRPSPMTAPM